MGEGREGDWECGGCNNRNYAFRSFCNICKQPRLLVDSKTPSGSKWLPRIGDWICSGCTNNNYASREKCKKCGQPKEVAAMPAMVMSGASFPTHPHYFSRVRGGLLGNGDTQHSVPLVSSWSLGLGGPDRYGSQSNSGWVGDLGPGFPYANIINQPHIAPKGWRNGDWICNCGFHNYSSRAQCKKCNGSVPPALGTKRLATEDFVQDWDNKRLNAGQKDTQINGLLPLHPGFGQMAVSDPKAGLSLPYTVGSSAAFPYLQMHTKLSQSSSTTIIGKGAKQWRDGDWMCTNCNNHNYASRTQCNKCKTEREAVPQSDSKE